MLKKKIKNIFTERLKERSEKLKIGDPFDPTTDIGALINENHASRVVDYINKGIAEGADLISGGYHPELSDELQSRNFVVPTIFSNCSDDMAIVREEIFGPVVSILSFKTEAEVIDRANATPFGLAAGVFTQDLKKKPIE